MKQFLACLAMLCLAGTMQAAHAGSDASDFRASLLVKGTIKVSDQGKVTGYTLDQPGKLPRVVVGMLQRAIPTWRFHPAVRGGHPVAVTATMHARFVATPIGDHRFNIRLEGTTYDDGLPSTTRVRFEGPHPKPVYPAKARREHVSGIVFVILRINRHGGVDKAAVRQVDLTSRGGPAEMAHARKLLAHAALTVARTWHFAIPTTGAHARDEYWNGRVAIVFRLHGRGHPLPGYGQWVPYIPGPPRYIPWVSKHELARSTAQPGGSLQMLGGDLRRINPHGG